MNASEEALWRRALVAAIGGTIGKDGSIREGEQMFYLYWLKDMGYLMFCV
jgi:hypothetical protein